MLALRCLPGVGNRTAQRYAFHLLDLPSKHLKELGSLILHLKETMSTCSTCGAVSDSTGCLFCNDKTRDTATLSVVGTAKDIFTIEMTKEYRGLYHVLGGLISPLDGSPPESLAFSSLIQRVSQGTIKEVILSLDSSVEGDATSLFLREKLLPYPVTVTRLAFGIPVGSSLDFVDQGSLAKAYSARLEFK